MATSPGAPLRDDAVAPMWLAPLGHGLSDLFDVTVSCTIFCMIWCARYGLFQLSVNNGLDNVLRLVYHSGLGGEWCLAPEIVVNGRGCVGDGRKRIEENDWRWRTDLMGVLAAGFRVFVTTVLYYCTVKRFFVLFWEHDSNGYHWWFFRQSMLGRIL